MQDHTQLKFSLAVVSSIRTEIFRISHANATSDNYRLVGFNSYKMKIKVLNFLIVQYYVLSGFKCFKVVVNRQSRIF